jgi:hypothetical protein
MLAFSGSAGGSAYQSTGITLAKPDLLNLPIHSAGSQPRHTTAEPGAVENEDHNPSDAGRDAPARRRKQPRPYIGILFECCGVYARAYRQSDRMLYLARCPLCLRTARVRVGKHGTDARLFRAY